MPSSKKKKIIPIAAALRSELRKGYSFKKFHQDFVAALVVSLVALPLSMALAIAVGLPPQHGIYTAIVAGIAAALLGGSTVQVSGPTAAFVVIVAPMVSQYGLRGLIIVEIMAGIALIIFGIARLGRFINFVPYPVTTGFTSGIAVVLATLSLNDFLGLGIERLDGSYIEKLSLIIGHLPQMNIADGAIGLLTMLTITEMRRFTKKIPGTIFGILAGSVAAYFLSRTGIEIATIGSKFSYVIDGITKHGIPPFPPYIHIPGFDKDTLFALPSYDEIRLLIGPAMVIAALASLESLLSATVADGMAGTKHYPNSELTGIGVSNILSGLAGGIPATGAIARTATNIKAGARTPFAAVMHAILIIFYVLLLAPLISYVPMASLSALLLVTAYHMSHYKQFSHMIRIAPRADVIVLLTCFGLTVFVDMAAGVSVGIVLAAFLFMQRIAELTETKVETLNGGKKVKKTELKLPEDTMIYRIAGPLFFGTAEKALDRSYVVMESIKKIIIDMEKVPLIDMTGAVAMKSLLISEASRGRTVILCGKKEIIEKITHGISPATKKFVRVAKTVKQAIDNL